MCIRWCNGRVDMYPLFFDQGYVPSFLELCNRVLKNAQIFANVLRLCLDMGY